ncbi:MAG: sigma-70 family RNA polymerase sigma factor [Eubacteriaceae bacterium]|nr:sigma-70 family RNA polymerase sigma factor [Eubacteriaceae bacterium]
MTVKNMSVTVNTRWDNTNVQNAKEYLSRAVNMGIDIGLLNDSINRLERAVARLSGTDSSLMHKEAMTGDAALIALKDRMIGQLIELSEVYDEISSAIMKVEDPFYRKILMLRYLDGMVWDEIADRVGYSSRNIYRKHAEALKVIMKYLPQRKI